MAEQEVQEYAAVLLRAVHFSGTHAHSWAVSAVVTILMDIIPQAAAEAALELNGSDVGEGHRMSVLISNPERKKERTDSDANDREVYVAGLSKYVTKQELEALFKTVSLLVVIRCWYSS